MKVIMKIFVYIVLVTVVLIIGYFSINLIIYNRIIIPFVRIEEDAISKEALRYNDLNDKKYIICKFARVTGYNFEIIKDENGKKTSKYCLVKGVNLESELSYEFLISGNNFIFYVTEKNQYWDADLADEITEYTVDGWDILYPVKRDELFNITPKYIIKNDLFNWKMVQAQKNGEVQY